ncbi:sialidase family protein [Streptococcus sp. S784/96/1]|uniref:sialidase family protein n=1 Tax=Streptococcus sp. S784/96/1 TaxID=2653499 RepID=UPI00138704A2|nr:exo-alpha-sialidase [Streptococcus sp. S784/96/1]
MVNTQKKNFISSIGIALIAITLLLSIPLTVSAVDFGASQLIQDSVYHSGKVELNSQGIDITTGTLDKFKSDSQSIVVKFASNKPNALQSLIGISNSSRGYKNNYFSIFMRDNGEIGIEVRDAGKGINYLFSRPASIWGEHKGIAVENTVVFVSDATNKSYSMFVNGTKIFTEYVDNYIPISSIEGQDNISLGGVNREGKYHFGMVGTIADLSLYNRSLSYEEIKEISHNSPAKLIFQSGDTTQANYFRIPALYTLSNGTVLASIDARYGGTHDSKSKINIATSYSVDNGETWSGPIFAMKFHDYEEQLVEWPRTGNAKNLQISGSASFIDSAIAEDKATGKVILLADVMPAGIGNRNADKSDSGYKEISGNYYLKLKKEGESSYNYTVREDGVIYDDRTGNPTQYSLNAKYEISEAGSPLMQEQYSVRFEGESLQEVKNGVQIPMNIFYKDSLFKVSPTNYIGVSTSDNSGQTWSDFKLLPPFLGVNHNATYLSPGQGLALSNSNRIIFATYTSGELTYLITEDAGQTWKKVSAKIPFTNATAEAQMVELGEGIIRTFFRTTTGKIAYMTSYDSGESWSETFYLDNITQTNYGTQVSAIKYSQLVDGKEAIILSTSNATDGRKGGQLNVGLVNPEDYSIDWKYSYNVDLPKYGYAYSSLTELPNHKIGVLFEKYDSWSRSELHLTNVVQYIDLDITDITR